MLLALYAILLIWQILWLVSSVRSRGGWTKLLILDTVSVALAFGLMWYFDTLPGQGIMPGWAYFSEVFYSLLAGGVYAVMTLVCALLALLLRKR